MLSRIKSFLLYNANQNNENSVAAKLRKKRFDFFKEYCSKLDKPLRILDLGGSDYHWKNSEFAGNKDFNITIINTEKQNVSEFDNFSYIKRDVMDLDSYNNREYDLIYSNSLIEHINDKNLQLKLANDIRRIGKHYFVQTPNYFFPVEPHFLFPFFQYLPIDMKSNLIMKYDLGWYKKQSNREKAYELASSIRLLKRSELKKMFPDGNIYQEKYLFLNKSFIIYK